MIETSKYFYLYHQVRLGMTARPVNLARGLCHPGSALNQAQIAVCRHHHGSNSDGG